MPSKIDDLLESDVFVDKILPNMIANSTKIAKARAEKEVAKALQRMKLKLNHEINRLMALQKKNNNIRPEEIETAIEERTVLENLIQSASVRLDALLLIRQE